MEQTPEKRHPVGGRGSGNTPTAVVAARPDTPAPAEPAQGRDTRVNTDPAIPKHPLEIGV